MKISSLLFVYCKIYEISWQNSCMKRESGLTEKRKHLHLNLFLILVYLAGTLVFYLEISLGCLVLILAYVSTSVLINGGARGVMVIVVGNGHGDTSSNPGGDRLHFHISLIPLGKIWIQLFSLQQWVNSRTD